MNARTAWEERSVVKDAGALMDAAAQTSYTTNLTLDLIDAEVSYDYDPGQPGTRWQEFIRPTVTLRRVVSPKLPGVNLLALLPENELFAMRHAIICEEEGL